jgi:hypothetical protein
MTTDQERLIELLTTDPACPDDSYLTMRQLVKKTGKNEDWIRNMLRDLADDGRLECQYVQRMSITGSMQRSPGYRLKA